MGLWDKIRDKILPPRKDDKDTLDDLRDKGILDGPDLGGAGAGTIAEAQQVDVEEVLEARMAAKGNPDLNWRTSIVDLMKLLDLDSSLDNRKELADELGYSGAKEGSAEMNLWLHKEVMRRLATNGGKVPAGLAD